jgi:argininosuccinate lyase
MQKLWHKNWKLNEVVEAFETQGDLSLDQKLIKFDVLGSLAHAQGLLKIGLLSEDEITSLTEGLLEINTQSQKGQFLLQFGDEDIHSKIENYLTDALGDVGKKIHTGRSRNDQVLTAIRLFTKENLLKIWQETLKLIDIFQDFAENYSKTLMPGYTHMQKAMPSTVGMWAGAFAEGFTDDLVLLKAAYKLNNQSPLGSAAGYGVPLDLDRQYVADLLGFDKVQINSLYCQNSRGKIESAVVAVLVSILQGINKFTTDILLFTTSEFDFFNVAPELCSGSSIMPQKKNVDIAELLRSKVHLVLGNYTQLVSLSSNLTSGYNRDLQDSKKPLFDSLELTIQCLRVTKLLISSIMVNSDKVQPAMTRELFATQHALGLVKQGVPFREAYQQAAQEYQNLKIDNFSISQSTHLGGTGNLGLGLLRKQLQQEQKIYQQENQKFQTIVKNLLSKKGKYEKQD